MFYQGYGKSITADCFSTLYKVFEMFNQGYRKSITADCFLTLF